MSIYGIPVSGGNIPCNSTSVVLQDAFSACSTYVGAVQQCTIGSVDQRDKFQIVNQTALCLNTVFVDGGYSPGYANYIQSLGPPPSVPVNASCKYPDFLPIVEKTCSFDFSQLNYTACDQTNSSTDVYFTGMTPWTRCVTVSLFQYWRCTQQETYDNVAACVENTAVRADWLPIFEEYSGAESCPQPTSWLLQQVGSLFSSLAMTIVANLVVPWLIQLAKIRYKSSKLGSEGQSRPNDKMLAATSKIQATTKQREALGGSMLKSEDEKETPQKLWVRETQWNLSASHVLRAVVNQVIVAYLTTVALRNSGQADFFSVKASLWQQILFWSIRPRISPIIGLLGFYKPFSKTGLGEVFSDFLISWFAGLFVMTNYWGNVKTHPANPAAPVHDLQILAIGSLLSCVPAFCFLLLIMLIVMVSSGSILYFFGGIIAGIAFVASVYWVLPIIAVVELIAWGVVLILKCFKKLPKNRKPSRWEQPLRFNSGKVFPIIYGVMVLSSLIIAVGNWLFLAKFLDLQGNMFCPADESKIVFIWYLVPLAIDVGFYSYEGLSQSW